MRILLTIMLLTVTLCVASADTPAEFLKRQPKPVFREGHTLLPLTRYGWTLDFDTRVTLAEDWGYCLEFGGYVTEKTVARLDDPDSTESRLVALAAKDPKRYPLSVICSRRLPYKEAPVEAWTRDKEGKFLNAKARSLDGTEWQPGLKLVWSAAAPDSVWELAGKYRAEPISKVRAKCPIAIVLNGGEYGIGVLGFTRKVWEKDPRIVKDKGEMSWYEYVSRRKANAENIIADAVKAVVPERDAYIYYQTTGCGHRNRYGRWYVWTHDFKWMKTVSDYASGQHYYKHFNSGWTGNNDMLTQALNARGYEITEGRPLCYDWLCGGWTRGKQPEKGLGEIDRYMGYVKCVYVTGMVGGNAGYYAHPKGGFAAPFETDTPPHWLRQMIVLSRAHALFTHLDDYIREGDLLPGPDKHEWSKNQPAYEFPSGDKTVRVLARKKRGEQSWLIAAWAADGGARDVEVQVPELGKVALTARPAGSVYRATLAEGKPQLELVDRDPLMPTQHMRE